MWPQRGCQGIMRWLALPLLLVASLLAGCSAAARAPLHDLHLPGVTQISSIQTLPPKRTAGGRPFGGMIDEVVAYVPPPSPSASIQGGVSAVVAPASAGRRLAVSGSATSFHVVFLRDHENAYDGASDGSALRHLDVLPICLNHLDATPDGRWVTCSDGRTLYSYALAPSSVSPPRIAIADASVGHFALLTWAPDGQHFAAETNVGTGCSIGIFTTSAARDRVDLVALLAFPEFATTTSLGEVGCDLEGPAWSPDGAWLAFSAGDSASSALYTLALASVLPDGLPTPPAMRSVTVTLSQLVFLGTIDSYVPVSWHNGPQGESVTVVDAHQGIVDIDLTTHRQTTLLRVDEGEIDTLSWTPDGQHLVFAQGQPFCPDCQLAYTPSHLYVYTPSEAGAATPSATR